MDKEQIINILAQNKEVLKRKFNVLKVGLFGSYSKNSFTERSDIDIVYELEEGKKDGIKGYI